MHAPAHVDVQDTQERVAPGRVGVAADAGEEGGDGDVGPDVGVQDPFAAQVGYSGEVVGEGVQGQDGDCVARGKALAGEEAEEGCFAGAVGWGGIGISEGVVVLGGGLWGGHGRKWVCDG